MIQLMKSKLFLLLVLLFSISIKSQTILRKANENKDTLLQRIIDKKSIITGNTLEFAQNKTSILLYSQLHFKSAFISPEIYSGETYTTFNLLYSQDGTHYTNYIIDTLAKNSGCCPCWLPERVSSNSFKNLDKDSLKEIKIILRHAVLPTCNSVGYDVEINYDDLESFIDKRKLKKVVPSKRIFNH